MGATARQISANRMNSAASTGPISAAGKAVTSRNATQHGLLSSRLLLDDEDAEEFHELLEEITRTLRPVGAIEHTLAERIGITIWRQRRLA